MKRPRTGPLGPLPVASLLLALAASADASAQGVLMPGGPTRTAIAERFVLLTFVQPVTDSITRLTISVDDLNDKADLFVRRGQPPTELLYDVASASSTTGNEVVVLDESTTPPLRSGNWYYGIRTPLSNPFTFGTLLQRFASSRPGMGAHPYLTTQRVQGTTFRVWAPNADSVHVAGSFNAWSSTAAPLVDEGNGNWSLDLRNVDHGAEYKYVIRNGASTIWRTDARSYDVTSSVGNSKVYDHARFEWSDQPYGTPTWNDLVVYEMHVGTFSRATPNTVGTFDEVVTRLPYLQDLGVSAIQLMPVCEFAADLSWGYNYSHPYAVENAYGGPDALKRLVDAAHDHGIAVLLDVLYNHWGPSDLDLWQYDGWSQGGWGGIYFYNDNRAQTPWGDTKPDFGRGEVRQYVRDNVLMWLEEYRMDGLRWDSTSTIRLGPLGDLAEGWSLMQWANDEVDASQGWKIQIAEDMYDAPNDWITKPTVVGGAGFDSQWEALFVHPVRSAAIAPNDNDRNMWAVRDAIAHLYNGNAFERVIYTESHDEVANGKSRVPEEIWPGNAASYFSKKRSTLAAAVALASPGIPMLFQGQEFLEDGFFTDTDPLDWTKAVTHAGIHDLYRDLIHLRRNLSGTTGGLMGSSTNVHHVNNGDKVIAWHRWGNGGSDDVVVLANFRNQAWNAYRIGLPHPGTWRVRFNSDWDGYDASFGNHPALDVVAQNVPYDGMPYSAELSFGAYTALVLSR